MSPANEYRPKQPTVAAKVAKPYKAVAEWCGGRVLCRYGKGSTVIGINFTGAYGEEHTAAVGDYIAADPANDGYFIKYNGDQFERYFERTPSGSQNT